MTIELSIVARTNVLHITPVSLPYNEAPWFEVNERLMDITFGDGRARLIQHNPTDYAEYFFETDVQQGVFDYVQVLEDAIQEFADYLYDFEFKMIEGYHHPYK